MTIQDKVVVITGASSGIGEATAYQLAEKGAKLVLGARREDKLKSITEKIVANGGQATYRVTDVTRREDNLALVTLAKNTYGKVDVVFLNAGLMPNAKMAELEQDNWDAMIDINIKGVTNGIAAVLPEFRAQQSGQIITTSSVAGLKAYPGGAVYGATKFAVKDLMEVLRMEQAQDQMNIRTTTLYPAAVQSELVDSITNADTKKGMRQLYDTYEIPAERVANAVAFVIDAPEDTTISELTIGPTNQPW